MYCYYHWLRSKTISAIWIRSEAIYLSRPFGDDVRRCIGCVKYGSTNKSSLKRIFSNAFAIYCQVKSLLLTEWYADRYRLLLWSPSADGTITRDGSKIGKKRKKATDRAVRGEEAPKYKLHNYYLTSNHYRFSAFWLRSKV